MIKVHVIEQLIVENKKMLIIKMPDETINVNDQITCDSCGIVYVVNEIIMPTNPSQLNTIALSVTQLY